MTQFKALRSGLSLLPQEDELVVKLLDKKPVLSACDYCIWFMLETVK